MQSDGIVGQLVWDCDTVWHAGNWQANITSIGIEHAGWSVSPYLMSQMYGFLLAPPFIEDRLNHAGMSFIQICQDGTATPNGEEGK